MKPNTCKRCKHLDTAKGFGDFNHYCTHTCELFSNEQIAKHTCPFFEHENPRTAVSIFKYVKGKDGKYHKYYLCDEEVLQLFAGRTSEHNAGANQRRQNAAPDIEVTI